jgi:hypothetical protein
MFCLVHSISRHGLLKDITNFVFEWETTKTAVNPPNFWVLVKIIRIHFKYLLQVSSRAYFEEEKNNWHSEMLIQKIRRSVL